jgi:hypothetical protein
MKESDSCINVCSIPVDFKGSSIVALHGHGLQVCITYSRDILLKEFIIVFSVNYNLHRKI